MHLYSPQKWKYNEGLSPAPPHQALAFHSALCHCKETQKLAAFMELKNSSNEWGSSKLEILKFEST